MTIFAPHTPHRITIASGKGGVGKTSIAVNLAIALAQQGKRTMLLDYDPGTANVAMLLGMRPALTIADIIGGGCEASDAVVRGPGGIDILPGHSGSGIGSVLGRGERAQLDRSIARGVDARAIDPHAVLIIDLPAGCSPNTLECIGDGDELILVLTPEPTSFLDAFALIKGLSLRSMPQTISVVSNMAAGDIAAEAGFAEFARLSRRLIGAATLRHVGAIPRDAAIYRAIVAKAPVLMTDPSAPASRAIARMPSRLWPVGQPAVRTQTTVRELSYGVA